MDTGVHCLAQAGPVVSETLTAPTYGAATQDAGPSNKQLRGLWKKWGLYILRVGGGDTGALSSLHATGGSYAAHFTVLVTGEVRQHYPIHTKLSPGSGYARKVMQKPAEFYVWIGVVGSSPIQITAEQQTALYLLVRWLQGVVLVSPHTKWKVNLVHDLVSYK